MTLPTNLDQRHIVQANHNEKLLHENCFPDPCVQSGLNYTDWTVTIAFYVALHYVQAYLARKGFRTAFISHKERNDYLKDTVSVVDTSINKILTDYLSLYKLSKLARYTPCHFTYFGTRLLCRYSQFALQTVPKALKLP